MQHRACGMVPYVTGSSLKDFPVSGVQFGHFCDSKLLVL